MGTEISFDGPETLEAASSALKESSAAPMGADKSPEHRVRGRRGLRSAKPLVRGKLKSRVGATTLRDTDTLGSEAAQTRSQDEGMAQRKLWVKQNNWFPVNGRDKRQGFVGQG